MDSDRIEANGALRETIKREARKPTARLEIAAFAHPFSGLPATIGSDLGEIRSELAAIAENVRHLSTKLWMFTTLLGALIAIGALMAVLFRFVPQG